MIEVRSATLDDLPVLLEFEQGIIAYERPYDPTLKEGLINYYDIKAMILSDTDEVVVATLGDTIIGSGCTRIEKSKPYLKQETHSYIGFMFVLPKYRGKGVSKLILDTLKEWTVAQGIYEACLTVYDGNANAIRAYEKSGFKKHIIHMRIDLRDAK